MGNSLYNNSAVQKQVLNLYDQLYQSYVLKNTSMLDSCPTHHDQESGDDLLNELQIIVMDNLETVISVSTAQIKSATKWSLCFSLTLPPSPHPPLLPLSLSPSIPPSFPSVHLSSSSLCGLSSLATSPWPSPCSTPSWSSSSAEELHY